MKTKIWSSLLLGFALFLFFLVESLCLSGCKNPFKTRRSPPPVIGGGTWETPADPTIVIKNLLSAYNEKIISNFNKCLSDSFRFSAPEDSIDAVNRGRADLFADWDKSVESNVTANIFQTARLHPDSFGYFLSWDSTPPVPDDIRDSVAVLYRDYQLSIFHGKATPSETTWAKGTATFYLTKSFLGWWSIYFLSDVQAETAEEGWADFKAKFRQ